MALPTGFEPVIFGFVDPVPCPTKAKLKPCFQGVSEIKIGRVFLTLALVRLKLSYYLRQLVVKGTSIF